MGHFDGVNKAPTFESGNYFPCVNARYTCEIKRVIVKKTQKSGTAFIAEMKVLKSSNKDMPEGSTGTWLQKMENETVAYPALKSFALAACGVDSNDKEAVAAASDQMEQVLDAAVEKGALVGTKINLETRPHTTGKGAQFTKHLWSPASAE